MCLVSGFHNDEPVFEKIIIILRKGTCTKFACHTFTSSTLFLGCFKLESSKDIKILKFQDFVDVYPLSDIIIQWLFKSIVYLTPKNKCEKFSKQSNSKNNINFSQFLTNKEC